MKYIKRLTAAFLSALMLASGAALTSCNDDDEFSTKQYVGGVSLNVFGPSPVARGGELRFLGSGMNQITSIEIPGCAPITDIRVISDREIRVTVPQTAEPGKVILKWGNGEIVTKTMLSFTEPISLDEVSPARIKAGQTLTLKGDYLNLIHEVIFADDVTVDEADFLSHSRSEISLVVPEEAQSGKVIISDGAEIPNWIYSETELDVVLPSVKNVLDLTGVKPGNTVTAEGSDLDLVKRVTMPNDDEVEFTVADGKISFILPANVSDGTICMLPASGVKVAVATIGVALPEDVVADPATGLWGGDVLKLKGVNMELVNTVTFPGVADAVEPSEKKPTELTVTVPEGTQSGAVILTTGSGATVEVEISTLKPENVVYDPAPAPLASELTVKGSHLQNVVAVIYAGATRVPAENVTETEFKVNVPATLTAGVNAVSLELSNGEVVSAPDVELSAPECAYATVLPDEETEIRAGETFVLTIANESHLTGVQMNGQPVQYILNGQTLIVQVPQSAGKSSVVTLVSDNGQISYNIAVIPATHVGMVIWEGMWQNDAWAGNQDLAWGGFDWTQVPAGAIMTLYMTPTVAAGEWWCVSLRHGDGWGNLPDPIPGQYDMPEDGILAVELTQGVLDDLIAGNGLVITGQGYVLNKITLEWEVSLEVDVFGPINQDMGSWSINYECKPNDAFITAGLKPGMTLNFYLTPYADFTQFQTFNGHWEALTWAEAGGTNNFNTGTHDMSKISVVVTPEIYTMLTEYIDWGYCLICQGENIILNKITIE